MAVPSNQTIKKIPKSHYKQYGGSGSLGLIASGGGTALVRGARIVKGLIKKKLTNKMSKPKKVARTVGKGGNYRTTESGAGMTAKGVAAYNRKTGGNLQTAVTEKKPTGRRAKRRKSYCARSLGQMRMHNINCRKTPNKRICKARARWRC